jgi:hypothetical protein
MFHNAIFASLLGWAGISVLTLLLLSQSAVSEASASKQPSQLSKSTEINSPLTIKMFTYTAVDDYGVTNILSADSMEIRPRRFMAFNAKSVNEIILRRAHLTIFSYDEMEPHTDSYDFFEFEGGSSIIGGARSGSARLKMLGRVTRLVADQITIEFFQDKKKLAILNAETGLIKKRKEGATFFNATLQDFRSETFIKSRKILWDRKHEVFVIPGRYSGTASSGSLKGRSVEIDLDFTITSYKCLANCWH